MLLRGQQYDLAPWIDALTIEDAVKLMLQGFFGSTAPTPGEGIPVTSGTVTPNFAAVVASGSIVIPAGAIGASVIILTGTGTLNGVDQPMGVPWSEPNKLAASVTLQLANPGTARVYYGT